MTTISAADKARQDAARNNDGKFGNQLHGEPEGGNHALPPAVPSPLSALRDMEYTADLTDERHEHLHARRSHLAAQAAAGMIRDRFPDAANIIFEDHRILAVDHVTDASGSYIGLGPGDQFELYDSGQDPAFAELIGTIDYGTTFGLKDYASSLTPSGRPRYLFSVEIDPLLADPAPADPRWDTDPRTKALSVDEQDDLIEAAYHALSALEDAEEAADDPHTRGRHEALRLRLEELLSGSRADR